MPRKLPDIQVLIPYRDLCRLLAASAELESLKKENGLIRDQLGALRHQFTELLEQFRQIQD